MRTVLKRAKYFITVKGKYYGNTKFEPEAIKSDVSAKDKDTKIPELRPSVNAATIAGMCAIVTLTIGSLKVPRGVYIITMVRVINIAAAIIFRVLLVCFIAVSFLNLCLLY